MQSFKVNCVLIATIFLWASAFVGIRLALVDYSPGPLALLRFLVASLCMAIIYFKQDLKQKMPWRHKIQLLLAGMAGIGIYNICLNYGEVIVSAGIASFVIGLMPVITILLSLFFLQEKLSAGGWAGIFISLLGLLLLTFGESAQPNIGQGILLILISAFVGSVLTIVQKKFVNKYSVVAIMAWIMWGGTLLLLLFSQQLVQEINFATIKSTMAVIYMGIFPAALAYLAWTYVLKKLTASKASVSLYALPLASTLLGFILLHEQPSLLSLVGGGIALIGAFIAHKYQEIHALTIDNKALLT